LSTILKLESGTAHDFTAASVRSRCAAEPACRLRWRRKPDLGLCGPFRMDLAARTDLRGAFKVPTLRNVAISAPYFRNGRFRTLKEVVGFCVRRDTNPEEGYARNADGSVSKYDDLPPQYQRNVNATEVPYNRRQGDAPALTPDEIDLIVEFLNTLTDGYQP
jgi:cytochrome c peroxidase